MSDSTYRVMDESARLCNCADPENCKEVPPGVMCRAIYLDDRRRHGHTPLRGRPLDDNGAIKFEKPRSGWVNGTLYCYGGCGTRYADFVRDVTLSTSLWNRIAVGPPFDETQENIEREGRGGVLCPTCIVKRLAALPDCTVILMDIR